MLLETLPILPEQGNSPADHAVWRCLCVRACSLKQSFARAVWWRATPPAEQDQVRDAGVGVMYRPTSRAQT